MTFLQLVKILFKNFKVWLILLVGLLFLEAILSGLSITLIIPFLEIFFKGVQQFDHGSTAFNFVNSVFVFFSISINIINIVSILIVLSFCVSLLSQFNTHYTSKLYVIFSKRLSEKLLTSYLNANIPFYYNIKTGKLVNTITMECDRSSYIVTLFSYLLRDIGLGIVYLTIPVMISWQLTLFVIIMSFFVIILLKRFHKKAEVYGLDLTNANADLQNDVNEKLTGIRDIKSGVSENRVYRKMIYFVSQKLLYRYKTQVNVALVTNIQGILANIILGVIILLSFYYFELEFTEVALVLVSFNRLIPSLKSATKWYNEIMVAKPSLSEIYKVIESANNYSEIITPEQILFDKRPSDITFNNVAFSYSALDRKFSLDKINLVLKKNKITALLGESGMGKSTIVSMILGFNKATKGEIKINNIALDNINIKSFRKSIGYIAQDAVLFNDTIKNNIKWYAPSASDQDVINAAKIASIDSFIVEELPDGYDTIVGERGMKLSGGQKQRIILARSIIVKPSIIILDEATSNLDSKSESIILKAIKTLSSQVTVILITHRIETTKIADYVYWIKDGQVSSETPLMVM